MKFDEILRRANLNSLQLFLKYGEDDFRKEEKETYSQRIKNAREKAIKFFAAKYPDIEEFDKIYGYFDEQTSVYEEVYFEIGLIVGAKIAFQTREKIDNLL